MNRRALTAALIGIFILSGAAGLIYESLWSRYLGLFVGHTAYAQIIVLVIFLGGMSVGAHLAARRTHSIRSPLISYAAIEVVVGVLAMVFHPVFIAVTDFAYAGLFPQLGGAALVVAKWSIAGLLILPQSILLGATFPLMSAGVIRLAGAAQTPGRILALLYFANSFGAAVGVLFAGFVLIGAAGLPGTLLIAGVMNVVAGGVVLAIAYRADRRPGADAAQVELMPSAADQPSSHTVLLWVAFGTAVASFVYEIAWIRMLSLVLGSATHSFELMLSAFILGLALGAFWIRGRADRVADPVRLLAIVQWVMGLLAVATLPLYVESFDWMARLLGSLARNESGYSIFMVARYAVAVAIMLPATVCAGMTLPLVTRILMRGGVGERAIGTVYAVNTLGSIVGVVLAGLMLMPVLGLKLLLVFGALIDIGLGVWLMSLGRVVPRRVGRLTVPGLVIPVAATAVVLAAIVAATPFTQARLASGVYRTGRVDTASEGEFLYYKDGRTASVSVQLSRDRLLSISTNGKPDASLHRTWLQPDSPNNRQVQLHRDMSTQLLLPLVSLAHRPFARQIAVIGLGSGISSHTLLGSPFARDVVTIEIEPAMVEGARHFMPANSRVYQDTRSRFVIDDAKSFFASTGQKWDLILSEPSNPWVSGVSGLFTEEFYARVKQQLSPGGVFGQWMHLYEMNDELVHSVLAAIDQVFPAYEVFFTAASDVIVVAANGRLQEPDWSVADYPDIKQDLGRVIPMGPEWFETLRLGGRDVLRPLVRTKAANSDFYPLLDLSAERVRYTAETARGYQSLSSAGFEPVAALSGRRLGFGVARTTPIAEVERSAALALGVRIRDFRARQELSPSKLVNDAALRAALHRLDRLERMVQSGRSPDDWQRWVSDVVEAHQDVHAGTSGVVDTVWVEEIRRYAARLRAPPEARAALNFLHGISAWDWPEVALSAKLLLATPDQQQWLPPALLRNGAVTAFIMTRDTAAARRAMLTFRRKTGDDSFREEILGSILAAIDSSARKIDTARTK